MKKIEWMGFVCGIKSGLRFVRLRGCGVFGDNGVVILGVIGDCDVFFCRLVFKWGFGVGVEFVIVMFLVLCFIN